MILHIYIYTYTYILSTTTMYIWYYTYTHVLSTTTIYIYVILHTYVYIYYYLQQLHVCDTTHIYVLKHIVAHMIVAALSIIMTILTTIYKLHDTYSCSLRPYIYFSHIYLYTHTQIIYNIMISYYPQSTAACQYKYLLYIIL